MWYWNKARKKSMLFPISVTGILCRLRLYVASGYNQLWFRTQGSILNLPCILCLNAGFCKCPCWSSSLIQSMVIVKKMKPKLDYLGHWLGHWVVWARLGYLLQVPCRWQWTGTHLGQGPGFRFPLCQAMRMWILSFCYYVYIHLFG